jgi:hypothetical protein
MIGVHLKIELSGSALKDEADAVLTSTIIRKETINRRFSVDGAVLAGKS